MAFFLLISNSLNVDSLRVTRVKQGPQGLLDLQVPRAPGDPQGTQEKMVLGESQGSLETLECQERLVKWDLRALQDIRVPLGHLVFQVSME